jgi:transcriptional regulator with XRE-family HTH domain
MDTIASRRKNKGLTQGEMARRCGISKSLVAQIETNAKPLTKNTAEKLAPVLGCTVMELLFPDAVVSGPVGAVIVCGHIQAGEWREALEWPEDSHYSVMIADDRYQADDLMGLEVRGDSMNKFYIDGTIIICRAFDPLLEMPPVGKNVVTQRCQPSGLIEATVKRLEIDDHGKGWLVPYSDNASHQPIPFGPNDDGEDDVTITAVVVGSYRKE